MKLLSVGDPRSGLNLQRVLYRLGMGATTELDPHEVEQMKHKLPTSPQAVASPNLKSDQFEDVTTFAGAFSCARLDLPGGHFWLSAEAPVFHLAKAALVDGTTLELFAMGEGATDTLGEVRAPPKRSLASTADAGAHR